MIQKAVLWGATGNVGHQTFEEIAKGNHPGLGHVDNPTVLVGVANSKEVVLNPLGFDLATMQKAMQFSRGEMMKALKAIAYGAKGHENTDPLKTIDELRKLNLDGEVIHIDATAEKSIMSKFHLGVIEGTDDKMVTANKNPAALSSYEDFYRMAKDPARYFYSATVMAGGPMPFIQERDAIGDNIEEANASLSGTLGYLATELGKGRKFSEAIREAVEKGYAEPDFRDDLNGLDVARKLVIIARDAGHAAEMSDVQVEPFLLPQEYFDPSLLPKDCLLRIEKELDSVVAQKYEEAKARGNTIKFVAKMAKEGEGEKARFQFKVGPQEVPLNSSFGQLQGTMNRIEVITRAYSRSKPWELNAPGAGLEVTAMTLLQDMVRARITMTRKRADRLLIGNR